MLVHQNHISWLCFRDHGYLSLLFFFATHTFVYLCIFSITDNIILFVQDIFLLQTPGGGGFGQLENELAEPDRKRKRLDKETATVSTTVGRGSVYNYQRAQESV